MRAVPTCLLHHLLLWLSAASAAHDSRAFPHFTAGQLATLSAPDPTSQLDPKNAAGHLAKMLIPRPPDTANNTLVRNYIVSHLRALSWDVQEDSFKDSTPYGEKTFVNVIATKDKHAASKLVLSAHHDSKFFPDFPENQFVGATDSAAPCAIMLDLATVLDPFFPPAATAPHSGTTLQLVFFDGEEAYKQWTATDSTYGSRHLAAKWSKQYVPTRSFGPAATVLSTIEHLVLLDLLGAASPLVTNYFADTGWLFDHLVSSQARLAEQGLLDVHELVGGQDAKGKWEDWDSFFVPRTSAGMAWHIEDDHIPFLKQGVPILHVIASPFPRVWHTLADDATALNLPTLKRWNLIFRLFTAEYLGLAVPEQAPQEEREKERRHAELVSRLYFVGWRPGMD
ncbi:hypothetical protein CALCODRAFT_510326 [Calocera cornea HHB12733]|uniref:Peptide hydrolase n=1 Tax=Calocera cornea HHB12733 TaxID=1353952 RepID=A0A165ELC5_9BASI|nr:hypothetical protein CALCODRAFT_510326 [Calocera cornea HHB12733]